MSTVQPKLHRPGLQSIADELSVSVSLVSKVLNGRLGTTGARGSTASAIRAKAEELGYTKNSAAAALATGRQNAIGVFIHRLGVGGSSIMEQMLQGIANEAASHGQRLMLQLFESPNEFRIACPKVQPTAIDGLLVGGIVHRELTDELLDIHARGVKVITFHDQAIDARLPNVAVNQVAVMKLATRHLIERGCKRIAHISNHQERLRGYQEALAEAGLPYHPELVYNARNFEYASGAEAIMRWLAAGIEFDGVAAQSDQLAVAAFNTLVAAGRKVPQQVKIIGVDNSPFCELNSVRLSSVSQEDRVRARRAVQLLMDAIDGRAVEPSLIEPALYARESSL